VNPLHVVEEKVLVQAPARIGDHRVLMEINLLIFDRSPETFHKDVVVQAAPAIPADSDLLLFQTHDDLLPKDVPRLKLEFCHFMVLSAAMLLVLGGDTLMSYAA
jgi:hypothetical protein